MSPQVACACASFTAQYRFGAHRPRVLLWITSLRPAMGLTMTQVIHAAPLCACPYLYAKATAPMSCPCRHVHPSSCQGLFVPPIIRQLPPMFFVYRKHTSSAPVPTMIYDGAWLGECVRTLRSVALKNTIVSAVGGVVEHYHWSIDVPLRMNPLRCRLLNRTCESAYKPDADSAVRVPP